MEWLYGKGVRSYAEMTNFPKTLRDSLSEQAPLFSPAVLEKKVSDDGTRKYLLQFHDDTAVETVAIPSYGGGTVEGAIPDKITVCVSSQVGCAIGCAFCATGQEGFTRNLLAGEIVDQVLVAREDFGARVSNVVVMGQGEPFLNYDHVLSALRLMNHPKTLAIGARHITVSTSGVLAGIRRLAQEPEQFTLAVSLHAARQDVRDRLMPKLANSTLRDLRGDLIDYTERTHRRVTLEYCLISGENDAEADLLALMGFCKGLLCHVNLLPMNAVPGSGLAPSPGKRTKHWLARLEQAHIPATIRHSRGADILGACGQLKNSR